MPPLHFALAAWFTSCQEELVPSLQRGRCFDVSLSGVINSSNYLSSLLLSPWGLGGGAFSIIPVTPLRSALCDQVTNCSKSHLLQRCPYTLVPRLTTFALPCAAQGILFEGKGICYMGVLREGEPRISTILEMQLVAPALRTSMKIPGSGLELTQQMAKVDQTFSYKVSHIILRLPDAVDAE